MEKHIIGRGLLAGALAGVVAFIFARIFVEPTIERAIAYEDAVAHAHGGHEHGIELFTRGVQANVGMGFGVLAFSVAMGALFAVVYCVTYGRVGAVSPRVLSLYVAGAMFLSLYVIPYLKYPPSPPALSLDETINQRTLLYLLMVALSAALCAAAVYVGRRLVAHLGTWNASLVAAGGYVLAIGVVMLVLPGIHETPSDFPADVLYEFRIYSLGTQVVMWLTIALVFAPMAARLLGDTRRQESVSA